MLLRIVDFETTGFPPDAGICEIGWCDVWVGDGKVTVLTPNDVLVYPGRPIPPETRAVHHISDNDVASAPPADEGLKKLWEANNGWGTPNVYVAHNAKFERALWMCPMPWICTRKIAMRLWPESPNYQNQTLRYYLGVDDDEGFVELCSMPPHRAGPDAYVTAHILKRALYMATVDDLVKWTDQPSLLSGAIKFGKHKGTPWSKVDPSYLDWVVNKATEMDEDVKFTARHWLARRRSDNR